MALEELVLLGDKFAASIVLFGQIILGIVGIYALIWLVNLFFNIKKNKLLKEMLENLKQINEKLDKKK